MLKKLSYFLKWFTHFENFLTNATRKARGSTLPSPPPTRMSAPPAGLGRILECVGEERFGQLLEEHGSLPSQDLRARILVEVDAFVGDAEQHDDMTVVLLRIDDSLADPTRTPS